MTFKQGTLSEVIESERGMVLSGAERYGQLFQNAIELNAFLGTSIKTIDADRFVFAGFLALIRKHHLLAILSIVRWHHVQAMMNLRQVLEAGACAAYALENTDPSDFADTRADGSLDPSQKLVGKRYKWLEENYRLGSDKIKKLKDHINVGAAHANIVSTSHTLRYAEIGRTFPTSFFDEEDDFVVNTDLWLASNVAIGLIDLFYEVNRAAGSVKFVNDFTTRFQTLMDHNERHKQEMMASDDYKRIHPTGA